ncbi:adenine phosphoribosyltransferase [bacterium DOLJORAL78_65_58]|nr:MAG: adenine phosphoribosyltransferase [bacterium DOLZORAL124_64_63]PIE75459.1 MAG: adenine phosphoribosyltransferase [bacterium DOLJORAL78_65_58]
MDLSQVIRDIPDFPKPGIIFKDITPVMSHPEAYRAAVDGLENLISDVEFSHLAGVESRGFIFAGPMALDLNCGLVLMRKQGKLPASVYQASYDLEYGQATLEMHKDAVQAGKRVIIVDDLLATGGTALASAELVRKAGAEVAGFLFLVELKFLGGRQKMEQVAPVFSLVEYD